MKRLSIALAIVGLLASTLLVGWFGFDHVANAVLSVGMDGLAALIAWQMLLFVVLGLAWHVVSTQSRGLDWVFVWARMVRDSAANCLPFSAVGGFVFGARALTLHGIPWPRATASVVVDATAEVLAQMVFVLTALCILVSIDPRSPVAIPLALGLGLSMALIGGFVWLQQGAATIFGALGRRIAGQWFGDASERVALLQGELGVIYRRTRRLMLGLALHFAGWIGTAVGTWIAYNLLGVNLDFEDAVAIEGLLRAVLAAAFLVPANVGVQEAGYAGFGILFGIPPDISLGVSILSRARDLAIGIPVLLIWQWVELRRLRLAPPAE